MQINFKSLLIILALLSVAIGGRGQNWVKVDIDTLVSVSFPSQPRPVKMRDENFLTTRDSAIVYVATWGSLGAVPYGPDNLDTLYRSFIKGLFSSSGGRELEVKNISIHGLRAAEATGTTTTGGKNKIPVSFRAQVVAVNGNLYGFLCTYADTSGSVSSERAEKFLSSFTLAPRRHLKQFRTAYDIGHDLGGFLGHVLFLLFALGGIHLLYRSRSKEPNAPLDDMAV